MYVISPITVLDDDKELFETHVGIDDKDKTLVFSAWGTTEEDSRANAEGIAVILNNFSNP